ncbi:sensor histidine kinase [Bacillus sp. AFS041924]|uniref:sensor histidine kinase n=1 Tax=Bacillus sp. AFS041924 TaxID=2033503 RepID=UPI000BFB7911|nr:sensor histidine kinase [Bacillus sp. AFS041924]PGS54469.1 histidine kinase [Bacillus sp. AFS041924]
MIKTFLIERFSWILFFLLTQIFILFVSFIDSSIPLTSLLYIVFLSLLLFIIFLVVRYPKETRFYKSLIDREDDLDLTGIEDSNSPFEEIVENSLTNQTILLKKVAIQNQTNLEEEKDDLLSWIHEVKTPLTAMNLMIDRMKDEKLKSNLTFEWLRIHLLLDQQLHQKRIPFIENDLYIEKIQLEDVIFPEIKTLQSWCIHKGIGFDLELEALEVYSDAKWLSYIIRQLLTNAVKYSTSSDILITSKQRNEQVILEIEDFGRGIHSKDLPRIFEKGFTSTTQHQDNASTGMGLYLAQKAALSLHITFQVKSELDKGSIFTLTFPKRNEFVKITSM